MLAISLSRLRNTNDGNDSLEGGFKGTRKRVESARIEKGHENEISR